MAHQSSHIDLNMAEANVSSPRNYAVAAAQITSSLCDWSATRGYRLLRIFLCIVLLAFVPLSYKQMAAFSPELADTLVQSGLGKSCTPLTNGSVYQLQNNQMARIWTNDFEVNMWAMRNDTTNQAYSRVIFTTYNPEILVDVVRNSLPILGTRGPWPQDRWPDDPAHKDVPYDNVPTRRPLDARPDVEPESNLFNKEANPDMGKKSKEMNH